MVLFLANIAVAGGGGSVNTPQYRPARVCTGTGAPADLSKADPEEQRAATRLASELEPGVTVSLMEDARHDPRSPQVWFGGGPHEASHVAFIPDDLPAPVVTGRLVFHGRALSIYEPWLLTLAEDHLHTTVTIQGTHTGTLLWQGTLRCRSPLDPSAPAPSP